jgi:hypothetical protein
VRPYIVLWLVGAAGCGSVTASVHPALGPLPPAAPRVYLSTPDPPDVSRETQPPPFIPSYLPPPSSTDVALLFLTRDTPPTLDNDRIEWVARGCYVAEIWNSATNGRVTITLDTRADGTLDEVALDSGTDTFGRCLTRGLATRRLHTENARNHAVFTLSFYYTHRPVRLR